MEHMYVIMICSILVGLVAEAEDVEKGLDVLLTL